MEKWWDLDPSVRPHIADILIIFEAASRGWVSPTVEAIADLGLSRLASQNPSTIEPADTMSGTGFGTTGSGSVSPRGVEQLLQASGGVEGTVVALQHHRFNL